MIRTRIPAPALFVALVVAAAVVLPCSCSSSSQARLRPVTSETETFDCFGVTLPAPGGEGWSVTEAGEGVTRNILFAKEIPPTTPGSKVVTTLLISVRATKMSPAFYEQTFDSQEQALESILHDYAQPPAGNVKLVKSGYSRALVAGRPAMRFQRTLEEHGSSVDPQAVISIQSDLVAFFGSNSPIVIVEVGCTQHGRQGEPMPDLSTWSQAYVGRIQLN